MFFTGGRLLEFEHMMRESPGYKREPIETMGDQGSANSVYSVEYDKNRMENTDKPGGGTHNCNRFFMHKNREAR